MLTEDDVAALNDQACENNLGRQGEWGEMNEDGKAWARELARLAYEKGRAERSEPAIGFERGGDEYQLRLVKKLNKGKENEGWSGGEWATPFDLRCANYVPAVQGAPRPYECSRENPCGSCAVCWA